MFEHSIFKKQGYAACLYCVCFVFLMILLTGCGDGATNNSTRETGTSGTSDTGSASFAIQWHTAADDLHQTNILAEQAIEECSAVGIEHITCEVYDAADNLVAHGGPWPCDARQGIIDSIPSGSNLTFAVLGWDTEQTNIIYRGQTTDVIINPGQIEELDPIDAYEFVPANLSASAISDSQIDLTWTMAADISGTIAGYNIYRDGVMHDTATSTTYSDTTDLGQEIQHCYTVAAYDVYGNASGPSNQACASTSDNQPPTVAITSPEDGASYDQGVSVDFSGTAVDPEDDALTGESLVWTSNIDGGIGTGNSFSFATLSAGVHTITLTATDQDGAPASASITLTINNTEPPTVPGNLVATALSESQINLSWSASTDQDGIAQYRIYRDRELADTTSSTTYIDTGLNLNTRYCYTVTALDTAGNESSSSTEGCATTNENQPPSVTITSPENNTAYDQGASVAFSGTAVDPEDDDLTGDSLVWTSSIDNGIGTGNSFSLATLSAGVHTITFTATDQDGAFASASITLTINDTEPPSVPGNLEAAAVSDSQINLSWTAATDNVGVTGYQIYRDDQLASSTTATSYSDTDLSASTRYCYTVIALDAAGNASSSSTEDCATTIDNQPPNVTITSPEDGAAHNQGDTVNFSGTAVDPEDDVLTGASLVWTSSIDNGIGTGNDISLATLSAGVHTITLTATDQDGAFTSASITLTINDTEPPSVPGNLETAAVSDSQINLIWTAATDNVGVTGYQIYRDDQLASSTTTTSYSDTDLSASTQYCYTVTALDAAGNVSSSSTEDCATTNENQPPSVTITSPDNGTAYDQGASVNFSGTAVDPEDDVLTGDSLVWTSSIDNGIGTGNSFSLATLSAGVHTITLTARDQDGAFASAFITLIINDTEPPSIPGNLVATTVSDSQINLSWTAATDNVGVAGYQIYRDDQLASSTTATTYSDPDLFYSTTYCYTVIAVDAAGNPSGPSIEDCAITLNSSHIDVLFLNFYIDITDQSDHGYSELASHLAGLGYHVSQTNLTPITLEVLSRYDIVVFGGDSNREISREEAIALRRYPFNGRGLLLLADNGLDEGASTLLADLNLLAMDIWGFAFEANLLCDKTNYCTDCATQEDPDGGIDYPLISPTTAHPAVDGVESFVFHMGSSLVAGEGVTIAGSSDYSWRDLNANYLGPDIDEYHSIYNWLDEDRSTNSAVVVDTGSGGDRKVIAIGDTGMWYNVYFRSGKTGTRSLATSVFNYLSPGTGP